jgi:hypothetical protein
MCDPKRTFPLLIRAPDYSVSSLRCGRQLASRLVSVWILGGCLALAVVVSAGLWLALHRARAAATASDQLVEDARRAVREAVAAETAAHTDEIRRVLARERAETASLLVAEERRLSRTARRLRRETADVEGRLVLEDGTSEPLTRETLLESPEAALRLLAASTVVLAAGLVALRV